MIIDDCEFVCDTITKFFNTLYISGWFHHPSDHLEAIELKGHSTSPAITKVGFEHGGISESLGHNKGFSLQVLLCETADILEIPVLFRTADGRAIELPLRTLSEDRIARYESPEVLDRFVSAINDSGGARVLDVGGRDRSKNDFSKMFHNATCTVFDIHPGANVDVVGDAHQLSRHFPPEHFDAVMSLAVFEHLLMPWQAVCEINKVLKPGGTVLVSTHQTLGLHDEPWDFWRFSGDAWDALFNVHTGFEITKRIMDYEQFILPFILRDEKLDAEQSVGFEVSSVVAKKIGPCKMSWDIGAADVVATTYPTD